MKAPPAAWASPGSLPRWRIAQRCLPHSSDAFLPSKILSKDWSPQLNMFLRLHFPLSLIWEEEAIETWSDCYPMPSSYTCSLLSHFILMIRRSESKEMRAVKAEDGWGLFLTTDYSGPLWLQCYSATAAATASIVPPPGSSQSAFQAADHSMGPPKRYEFVTAPPDGKSRPEKITSLIVRWKFS